MTYLEFFTSTYLNYIDNWLNDFFLFFQELEDSQSLCVCRQGVILTIIIAAIQFLYTEYDDIDLTNALEKRISKLAAEYRQLPPITQEEQDWFKREQLKQLLILKDIPLKTDDYSSETLIESIWGDNEIASIQENTVTTGVANNSEEHNLDSQKLAVSFATEDTMGLVNAPEISELNLKFH